MRERHSKAESRHWESKHSKVTWWAQERVLNLLCFQKFLLKSSEAYGPLLRIYIFVMHWIFNRDIIFIQWNVYFKFSIQSPWTNIYQDGHFHHCRKLFCSLSPVNLLYKKQPFMWFLSLYISFAYSTISECFKIKFKNMII